MALFDDSGLVTGPSTPENPNLVQPTDTIAVRNKHYAYSDLITHAEGFRWKVKAYYSQYLTPDMEPAFLALNRDAVYQQYLKITDFEFRVESPLSPRQDPEGKEFTVDGAGLLYPGVVANVGDFFIAEVADGRNAIIEVILVEEPSMYKDTVMRINYRIRDYEDEEYRNHIASKVIETKVFVKDFFNYGKNPVVAEQDYNTYLKLADYVKSLTDHHFREFNHPDYNNLILPDQIADIIDLRFSKFVSTYLHGKYDRLYRHMAADANTDHNDSNLWDLLTTKDMSLLRTMSYENGTYSVSKLNWHPVVSPIRYAGYDYVYYPKGLTEDDHTDVTRPGEPRVFRHGFDPVEYCRELLADVTYIDQPAFEIPPFNIVKEDVYYVFSEAFYTNDDTNMSLLERLVRDHLEAKSVDARILIALAELIVYHDRLSMFYLMPILIWLIEAKMEDI